MKDYEKTKAFIKTKLFSAIIPLILLVIFVVQNTETIHVRFLFWDLSMPRSVMIFVVLLTGVAVGVLFRSTIVDYTKSKLQS